MKKAIYLDHAATTEVFPEVIANFTIDLTQHFANPSSGHSLGRNLHEKIETIKDEILAILQANSSDEFYFTSTATESNNTIIKGLKLKTGDRVLVCMADHASVTVPTLQLTELGVQIVKMKLSINGGIDEDHLSQILAEGPIALAIITAINPQSGNINDYLNIARMIKSSSKIAHIHVDAVQAFGKIKTTISPDIDSMSITAHKLGGPKGIAGLYLKQNHRITPLIVGGGQQDGFRAGTLNYPLINAFMGATKISLNQLNSNWEKTVLLNARIKEVLTKNIPSIHFPFEHTSPYILCFVLPAISSDIIVRHLEVKNIFIGTTSACSSRIKGDNPVLAALSIDNRYHKNVLRISLGFQTQMAEVEEFLNEFLSTWKELLPYLK